jgi:hypothetical protein
MNVTATTESPVRADVPDEVVRRAKAAFNERHDTGQLALEVFDSVLDEGAHPPGHRIRFEHPYLSIEICISTDAGGSILSGTVQPPTPQRAELQSDSSEERLFAPVIRGAFTFARVKAGPVRLHLSNSPDSSVIHTDWFRS